MISITRLTEDHLSIPEYDPDRLLNMLHEVLQVENDAQLAMELSVEAALISNVRRRHKSISAALMLRMHDVSGLTIENLRDLARIPQPNFE